MEFFMGKSIWVYLFIFFGKIIEVSVSTVRIVLINRGERTKGSLIALLDNALWIFITGTVLANFTSDLLKCIVFVLAFAIGNYVGSWVESKLALGMSSIQVIIHDEEETEQVINGLRCCDFGVTVMEGQGQKGKRSLLIVYLKRNRIPQALRIIKRISKRAFVTYNDVKVLCGGYITKKRNNRAQDGA